MKYALTIFCALCIVLGLAGCGGGTPTAGGDGKKEEKSSITIKGSDTMVILGQRWAETYMGKKKNVTIQVTGGGSGVGIAALINGGTEVCAASRPMKDNEKEKIKEKYKKDVSETAVALDGLAVFVSTTNKIEEISLPQLEGIYRGTTSDWKDVGGAPGKIVVYGRENNSGTYLYFKEHVLKNKDFANEVQSLPGTAAVINAVSKEPRSMGYGGIGYAKDVKILNVKESDKSKAIKPSMETVVSGEYPISRKLFFYTVGEPTGQTKAFVEWCLSDEGQKICEEVGYYPVTKK